MKKILSIALVGLLACGALLTGCGGEKKADPKAAGDKTKVAFVYVSSAKDGGYSMAHELGRQYVEKNMPNVQASYIESVPEGADSERVITQLASQGNKVIFSSPPALVIWTRRSTSRKNTPTLPSCTAPASKQPPT